MTNETFSFERKMQDNLNRNGSKGYDSAYLLKPIESERTLKKNTLILRDDRPKGLSEVL